MNGALSWFEMGVGNPDRARAFFGGLFGWEFADERGGASIRTPNVPGGIHGGEEGHPGVYLFFEVDDIDAALARVRELGGEAGGFDSSEDPETEARFGRFVMCHDDQGVPFGLHQPLG